MPTRLILAGLAALWAASTQVGCASMPTTLGLRSAVPNPLVAPSADYDAALKAAVAATDEYFDIASEDRIKGEIRTQYVGGATLLEPWRGDSVGFYQRLESTLQSIRRFAIVRVLPVSGGGYSVRVEVYKELEELAKPDRQTGGRAVFNNEFPVNRARQIVGPVPAPVGWIPKGRDELLEQMILYRIKQLLFL